MIAAAKAVIGRNPVALVAENTHNSVRGYWSNLNSLMGRLDQSSGPASSVVYTRERR